MGFILDSFANVIIEAIDTLVLWVCDLCVTFELDIGGAADSKQGGSTFSSVFAPSVADSKGSFSVTQIATAIGVLAILCVLIATIFKIYQLMISPYAKVESPGEIALKCVLSIAGVLAAYPFFRYFEKGFNAAYKQFKAPYDAVTTLFKNKRFFQQKLAEEIAENHPNPSGGISQGGDAMALSSPQNTEVINTSDAFVLGSDHLLPVDEGITNHPFALALIELFVGVALIIALVRLVLEIYERYVILAVLYLFAPLAFASIVAKGAEIFKNYLWMVVCQFILMCTNLVFLSMFMAAWYNILLRAGKLYMQDNTSTYIFANSQQFVTTMLLLLSWLVVGQKMDELLRNLGLSAAQTGQGLLGAALGSMMVIRSAVSGIQAGASETGKVITGQTNTQKAFKNGTGVPGLLGKISNASPVETGKKSLKDPPSFKGDSFNDGLNKAVHGQGSGSEWKGMHAAALGSEGSSARNINADQFNWEQAKDADGKEIPGVQQAYDSSTGNTYTRSTNDTGAGHMEAALGATDKHYGEINKINSSEGSHLVSVHPGDRRGKGLERTLPPRDRVKPMSNPTSTK